MARILIIWLLLSSALVHGQTRLVVRDVNTGKIEYLYDGKAVGLIARTGDTLSHFCCDSTKTYAWYLSQISSSHLTVTNKATRESKSFEISDVLSISFQRKTRPPVLGGIGAFSLFCGGTFIALISPIAGLEDGEPYNFKSAGIVFSIGISTVGLVLLDQLSGRKTKTYSIVGPE